MRSHGGRGPCHGALLKLSRGRRCGPPPAFARRGPARPPRPATRLTCRPVPEVATRQWHTSSDFRGAPQLRAAADPTHDLLSGTLPDAGGGWRNSSRSLVSAVAHAPFGAPGGGNAQISHSVGSSAHSGSLVVLLGRDLGVPAIELVNAWRLVAPGLGTARSGFGQTGADACDVRRCQWVSRRPRSSSLAGTWSVGHSRMLARAVASLRRTVRTRPL